MQKIVYGLILTLTFSSVLTACDGQTSNPVAVNQNKALTTFEEKQSQFLKNRKLAYPDTFSPRFSFRFAAGKTMPGVVHIKSVFPAHMESQFPDLFKDFFRKDFFHHYFPPSQIPEEREGVPLV